MADSIQNILLRITGNSDDARRDLQQTAAEVAAFDSLDAEADLDVDTAIAKAKIASLKRDIATLSDITLDVDADTGLARAQIAALNVELAAQEAIVKNAGDAMSGAGGSAGELGFALGGLTGKVGPLVIVVGALAAAIAGALVSALVALTASLAAATAGLISLGVAFGAALLPAIALGIGAMQRFKEQADQAGTPANRLKTAAEGLAQTFGRVLGPAADRVFSGLAAGMGRIEPMLSKLGPAFTDFGQTVGRAFAAIGRELSNPAWTRFFEQTIGDSSRLIGPLVSSFISLARIMRNIASAAMPFLVAGFQAMADGLRDIAKSTGDAGKLRGVIGGLVDHLRSWLDLIGQVGRLMFGIFKGAAPAGKELVDQLAQGAEKLADWANSAEGQRQIKQFFSDVVPLATALVGLIGNLTLLFIRFTQTAAPALTVVTEAISRLVAQINAILGAQVSAFNGLVSGAKGAAQGIAGAFSAAVGFVRAAFAAIRNIAASGVAAVGNIVSKGVGGAWGWVRNAASNVFSAVRSIASGAASAVGGIVSRAAGSAWHWIADAARTVASTVRNVISSLVAWIRERVNDAIQTVQQIGDAADAAIEKVDSLIDKIGEALSKAGDLANKANPANLFKSLDVGALTASVTGPVVVPIVAPVSLPGVTGSGSLRTQHNDFRVITEGTGMPDPDYFLAQLDAKLEARGGLG